MAYDAHFRPDSWKHRSEKRVSEGLPVAKITEPVEIRADLDRDVDIEEIFDGQQGGFSSTKAA